MNSIFLKGPAPSVIGGNPNLDLLKIDFFENQVSDRGRTTFPTKV